MKKDKKINEELLNENEEIKPKKNRKRIFTSILMYSGLIISIATISGISIFYSTNQTRNIKYIYDDKKDINVTKQTTPDNKTKTVFTLEKEILAKDFFDLEKQVKIKKQESNFGIHLLANYSFYKTGYNLDNFFNKNNSYAMDLDLNSTDKEIVQLQLHNSIDKFNEQTKHGITFKYFIQQLTSLKIALSYFFTREDQTYFIESKKDVTGFEIKEFFFQVHKYFKDEIQDKEIVGQNFIFKAFATTNDGIIEKIKFVLELSFEM
ncbi:hypothetical protein [Mycoplasmopsis arginini]|uniref:hypothetical protein n=1 Tax=Mycoplasmopsis arginini TaxID=2094 RepID=UPI0005C265DD|nr:hypothetical protein [Mycoplasmopsis arginini]BAQ54444.1 hypothetical protein MARG145_0427 [Mycoplasmopsis arginini]CRH45564.1 Uncharacterised protein [Chlamydia trachomatis]CRH55394.1 Uncharacterised protein [Chlamydia trachomatis]